MTPAPIVTDGPASNIDIVLDPAGTLTWNDVTYPCASGAGGISIDKREGDGATPAGCMPLRRVLYRPDRSGPPRTVLPVSPLTPRDGWCDDPADPLYNQQIRQPFAGSYEILWRTDTVYDLIVVLGYNDSPVMTGRGSAIFLHIARPDFSPTRGCIALAREALEEILASYGARTRLCVPKAPDLAAPA